MGLETTRLLEQHLIRVLQVLRNFEWRIQTLETKMCFVGPTGGTGPTGASGPTGWTGPAVPPSQNPPGPTGSGSL